MPNVIYCYDVNQKPQLPKTTTEEVILDLGVIDGKRYLSATESVVFSEDFEVVDLTTEDGLILKEHIKQESPLCRQIDEETIQKIRMKYDLNEELKALRTGDIVYKEFVETIVQEGKYKKTDLGL